MGFLFFFFVSKKNRGKGEIQMGIPHFLKKKKRNGNPCLCVRVFFFSPLSLSFFVHSFFFFSFFFKNYSK